MLGSLGFLLGSLNIRNLCFAYFFLAPFFINQGERLPLGAVFGAGYLFSLPIVALFLASRLTAFSPGIKFDKVTWVVSGLLLICFLSVAWNTPWNLLQFDRIFFWYLKFLLPASCFLIMVRVWKVQDLPRLYHLVFILGLLSLLVALMQVAFDFPPMADKGRISSFFRDSNGYALTLDIFLAFSFPLMIWRILRNRPYQAYAFLNAILLITIGFTGSRGCFLITASIMAVSILATRKWKFVFKLALIVSPFLILFSSVFVNRYSAGASMSDKGRLWSYLMGIEIVRDRPLLGVGYGNVLDVFGQYGRIYEYMLGKALNIHNAFLEIFAESGVAAFVLYCLLICVPGTILARRVIKDSPVNYPLADLAGLNIVATFFIYGLFFPQFLGHDNFWVYYSVVILLMRARIRDPDFHFRSGPSLGSHQADVLVSEKPQFSGQ
jgi:O-antigen ligase